MKRKGFYIIIILSFLLAVLTGCSDNQKSGVAQGGNVNTQDAKESIEIVSYSIGLCTGYSGKEPGISKLELKNVGEKTVKTVRVTVYYSDSEGNSIGEGTVSTLSDRDTPIKAGHTWLLAEDKYYPLVDVPDGVDLTKCSLNIAAVTYANEAVMITEEDTYVQEQMSLLGYKVEMCEGLITGKVPGLCNLEIKNDGDRILKSIEVTVTLCDSNGNPVGENVLTVFGSYRDTPLKAGYVWKQEADTFFELKNVPNGIDINKSNVEISSVAFE